jgi:glycosyltransferase involved in cell wall biosynthesis
LVPVLDFGGVESRLVLQSSMAQDRGYELRVCTFSSAGSAAGAIRAAGVPVDCLEVGAKIGSPAATLALTRYLRLQRPTILHASIVEANFHALIAGRLAEVRHVVVEEVGTPSHSWKARLVLAGLYRLASRIVAVSETTAAYLVDVDRAPRDRVVQIYNCAHPRFFPTELRMQPPRPPQRPFRILAVGRLTAIKNHTTLLDAFARVVRERPFTELWISGDGPLAGELRQRVRELGLQAAVRFLGYRDDVREVFDEVDLFVLPSHSEGCSISLIEALASALPAVGSRVPGITEVLGQELAARWTFPATDARAIADTLLEAVALDEGERLELGRRGQARAYERFSPEAYMARLDELYVSMTT